MPTSNVYGLTGFGQLLPGNLAEYGPLGIRSYHLIFSWKQFEPSKGNYDFSFIDARINELVAAGKYVSFQFLHSFVEDYTPEWLNTVDGVPFVHTNHPLYNLFPYYLHANYITAYYKVFDVMAAHVAAYPQYIKDKLIAWHISEGSTGDEGPYKGTPDNPAYNISAPTWQNFRKAAWAHAATANALNPWLPLQFNPGDDAQLLDYITTTFPGANFKAGQFSHEMAFDGEVSAFARQNKFLAKPYMQNRSRGEIQDIDQTDSFALSPKKNMFALFSSAIAAGLDNINLPLPVARNTIVGSETLMDPAIANFYNKYSDERDPAAAKKAMCALADKIDFADTIRFPETLFGPLIDPSKLTTYNNVVKTINNNTSYEPAYKDWLRWMKIVQYINPARKTAIINACTNASYRPPVTTSRYNDFYNHDFIIGGVPNFEKFLHQVNPNTTSLGSYRVGADSDMYGRYCRRFRITGTTAPPMQWSLDPLFNGGVKVGTVKISLTYFDVGTGSFTLDCVRCSKQITALSVVKTNTGLSKTVTATIDKFKLVNLINNVACLQMNYTGGTNTDFPLIELEVLT